MIREILRIRGAVRQKNPLIHCITNHITAEICADAILAVGGAPIMAEHPGEVAEITRNSGALLVNLGGVSDEKMRSMMISGNAALEENIPTVIDMVGVGCSKIRLDFARRFISECRPNVIKGNASEIKTICGMASHAKGVDAGRGDAGDDILDGMKEFSRQTRAVIVATGKIDCIVNKNVVYKVHNGCGMLSEITGTGCMLGALTACLASSGDIVGACVLGALLMGVCGELARGAGGVGSFKAALLDNIYSVGDETLIRKGRIET